MLIRHSTKCDVSEHLTNLLLHGFCAITARLQKSELGTYSRSVLRMALGEHTKKERL